MNSQYLLNWHRVDAHYSGVTTWEDFFKFGDRQNIVSFVKIERTTSTSQSIRYKFPLPDVDSNQIDENNYAFVQVNVNSNLDLDANITNSYPALDAVIGGYCINGQINTISGLTGTIYNKTDLRETNIGAYSSANDNKIFMLMVDGKNNPKKAFEVSIGVMTYYVYPSLTTQGIIFTTATNILTNKKYYAILNGRGQQSGNNAIIALFVNPTTGESITRTVESMKNKDCGDDIIKLEKISIDNFIFDEIYSIRNFERNNAIKGYTKVTSSYIEGSGNYKRGLVIGNDVYNLHYSNNGSYLQLCPAIKAAN